MCSYMTQKRMIRHMLNILIQFVKIHLIRWNTILRTKPNSEYQIIDKRNIVRRKSIQTPLIFCRYKRSIFIYNWTNPTISDNYRNYFSRFSSYFSWHIRLIYSFLIPKKGLQLFVSIVSHYLTHFSLSHSFLNISLISAYLFH